MDHHHLLVIKLASRPHFLQTLEGARVIAGIPNLSSIRAAEHRLVQYQIIQRSLSVISPSAYTMPLCRNGIPVISAQQAHNFSATRHASHVTAISSYAGTQKCRRRAALFSFYFKHNAWTFDWRCQIYVFGEERDVQVERRGRGSTTAIGGWQAGWSYNAHHRSI